MVTATSIIELQAMGNLVSGTDRKIKQVYVDVTSTGSGDTLALASVFSTAIVDVHEALDGASNDAGTQNTWSGTTITFDGHGGSGVWKLIVWGY